MKIWPIALGVAVVGLGAWFVFRRQKPASIGGETSEYSEAMQGTVSPMQRYTYCERYPIDCRKRGLV